MSLTCYHCGEPVPAGSDFSVVINQEKQSMCCLGCEAVAHAIVNGGLENYYRFRDGPAARPDDLTDEQQAAFALYDRDDVQESFVRDRDGGEKEASLAIEGITCAACVWLIEHQMSKADGVSKVQVNLSNHRASLHWNPEKSSLSKLMALFSAIGFQAFPYQADEQQERLVKEEKKTIRRLIIAGAGMMQAMMFAVMLYAGAFQEMEEQYVLLFRWLSLIVSAPVILYSAQPFFKAAIRDFKAMHLTMDVPVSLAIGVAFAASAWATITNSGDVYFDSVSMFTFFLLFGRYLEMRARHRIGRSGNALNTLIPTSTTRLNGSEEEVVLTRELKADDILLVKPGHTVPADGEIIEGRSSLNESALTGEYMPVSRQTGDKVLAGTMNTESPLKIRVEKTGQNARVANIVHLLDRAFSERPKTAEITNRVAHWFVLGVLVSTCAVGLYWWQHKPEDAFWIVLSVLVVTCPCALSLATPTALTTSTNALREKGLLVTRGHVIETLADATRIVFDKTGTLTEGRLILTGTHPVSGETDAEEARKLAAALERTSEHPIARAFDDFRGYYLAEQVEATPGKGLQGEILGELYRIGTPEYATSSETPLSPPTEEGQWLLLSKNHQAFCWFAIGDHIRSDAAQAVDALKKLGLEVDLLSGDHSGAVKAVSEATGISNVRSGASPEEKLKYVRELQSCGEKIIMVGDGVNDIPVLAGADISIAMGSATDLAKTSADAVLMASHLQRIADSIALSRKTRRVIRQNLAWALGYNLTALPLAAAGIIPPYLAAIGMSASSLIVVINALRLSKRKRTEQQNSTEQPETGLAS
ncbi:heavy metal translocating P-type ATPase [Oceanospirillum sediminis]|uniref:P-type Cu(2+) transporter n=1 Tax=Oceanospirillum sediminis TaxID=2760088 RepID=A0A839IKG9_9GAMM|nr:heavy metal translocating P-type ATPase [Oceanospirillum sediminis]MBB1485391.1 cadmium-translocating P-type ATPase [Oceanospirillum sediminis]